MAFCHLIGGNPGLRKLRSLLWILSTASCALAWVLSEAPHTQQADRQPGLQGPVFLLSLFIFILYISLSYYRAVSQIFFF